MMKAMEEKKAQNVRNPWLDLARFILAFFVVGIHASRQANFTASINQPLPALNPTLFRIAVPFFFLCTAYFATDRYLKENRDPKVFFKASLRYLILYLVWVALDLPVILHETYFGKNIEGGAYALWFFRSLFLSAPVSVLWFLRASAYGLAIIGLLAYWKKAKPIFFLPLCLSLYVLGAFGDTYYGCLNETLQSIYTSYFAWGFNTRNLVFFAGIFLLLGCQIRFGKENHDFPEKASLYLGLLFLLSLCALFWESYALITLSKPHDYNIFFSLLFADPLLFLFLLSLEKKKCALPGIALAGPLSSLVYFIHIDFRDAYEMIFANQTDLLSNLHLKFFFVASCALLASILIYLLTKNWKGRRYLY